MNKYDELEVLIKRIAKMNNRTLPTNLRKILEASPKETDGSSNQVNPLKIAFNSHYLKTTCLTLITWFTLIGLYFSLTLNLSNLGGDIYVNTVSMNECGFVIGFFFSNLLSSFFVLGCVRSHGNSVNSRQHFHSLQDWHTGDLNLLHVGSRRSLSFN